MTDGANRFHPPCELRSTGGRSSRIRARRLSRAKVAMLPLRAAHPAEHDRHAFTIGSFEHRIVSNFQFPAKQVFKLLSMPSRRKLFCSERPPLELNPKLFSSRAPGSLGAVPAVSRASCAKLRPVSGRFCTRLASTTWPSSDVSVSSSGAVPVTDLD